MASTATSSRRPATSGANLGRRESGGGHNLGRVLIALALLALITGLALWIAGFFSTPRELLEVRSLVDEQVTQLRKVARNEAPLTDDDAAFEPIGARIRELPPPLRDRASREMGRLYAARAAAEVDSYFALPSERRAAELDRRIRADEKRRQARAQRDAARGQTAAAGSPTGGAGRPSGSGPTAGGRRSGTGATEEERNARRKGFIDRTSPEERARRTEYRRAIDERRATLGLPAGSGRG